MYVHCWNKVSTSSEMYYFGFCQSFSNEIISTRFSLGFETDVSAALELVQLVSRMKFGINNMDTIVDHEVGI